MPRTIHRRRCIDARMLRYLVRHDKMPERQIGTPHFSFPLSLVWSIVRDPKGILSCWNSLEQIRGCPPILVVFVRRRWHCSLDRRLPFLPRRMTIHHFVGWVLVPLLVLAAVVLELHSCDPVDLVGSVVLPWLEYRNDRSGRFVVAPTILEGSSCA